MRPGPASGTREVGSGARKVGILGGTFNPPHVGHLLCAQEALWQLELDGVVLIPTRVPPHKEVLEEPGPEIRAALCDAAVADDGRLSVSRVEIDRPGPSYTVDTLKAIHATSPGDQLTFIVGGDMAASLRSWHEPEQVLELATLAVAERVGNDRSAVLRGVEGLAGADRLRFFQMPRMDVSSTDVRERVRTGRPIRYMVPDAVARMIGARGLYREAA